jgi:hypothetical protein
MGWGVCRVRSAHSCRGRLLIRSSVDAVGHLAVCFRAPGGWAHPLTRRAQLWQHRAALCGGPRQSPNRLTSDRRQRRRRCPELPRVSPSVSASAVAAAEPPPRLPCRDTPLHWAARNGKIEAIAELLLRGADGAVQNSAGYRCAAPHSRPNRTAARAQAHAEEPRGTRYVRGGGEAGARSTGTDDGSKGTDVMVGQLR